MTMRSKSRPGLLSCLRIWLPDRRQPGKVTAMTTIPDILPASIGYETRTLGRGEALFCQGGPAVAIFAIARGRLRLERHTPGVRLVPLHTRNKHNRGDAGSTT